MSVPPEKRHETFVVYCRPMKLWMSTVLFAGIIFAAALPAFAGLGEEVSSVQTDQARLKGTLRSTQAEGYTVHEIKAATGTVVREYVTASGKVFAVAWQWPWPPNMRQVLATYFDSYQTAAKAQHSAHAGRRPLVIEQPGLVVHAGGHMRSYAGHAYIPDMLPQGMSAEAIQ